MVYDEGTELSVSVQWILQQFTGAFMLRQQVFNIPLQPLIFGAGF